MDLKLLGLVICSVAIIASYCEGFHRGFKAGNDISDPVIREYEKLTQNQMVTINVLVERLTKNREVKNEEE